MGQAGADYIPLADYLPIEQRDHVRYEYHDGEMFRMAGGSLAHSRICRNVNGALYNLTTRVGRCEQFNSEIKIEVAKAKRYVYPDAAVACPEGKESDVLTGAIVNPHIVVEVVSPDSEGYDRGAKYRYYNSISTVREYLIVDQDAARVTVFRREEGNTLLQVAASQEELTGKVELVSIGQHINLAEIYRGVIL